MLKRKNKKALPEQLEDSLYPDDYWLDKEDGSFRTTARWRKSSERKVTQRTDGNWL